MSNNVFRARLVLIWCMSVMTIGAGGVAIGADLTLVNAALLSAACVLPPVVMLLMRRDWVPVAVSSDMNFAPRAAVSSIV
jgi:hypothetical protein